MKEMYKSVLMGALALALVCLALVAPACSWDSSTTNNNDSAADGGSGGAGGGTGVGAQPHPDGPCENCHTVGATTDHSTFTQACSACHSYVDEIDNPAWNGNLL